MPATLSPVSSRALVVACERLGIDATAMLDFAGLDHKTIGDPDARLPLAKAGALWAKAYELSGDPDLALHGSQSPKSASTPTLKPSSTDA